MISVVTQTPPTITAMSPAKASAVSDVHNMRVCQGVG